MWKLYLYMEGSLYSLDSELRYECVIGKKKLKRYIHVMCCRQLKNKVENNEGLPQPSLGSCNDRARKLHASSSGISPCLKVLFLSHFTYFYLFFILLGLFSPVAFYICFGMLLYLLYSDDELLFTDINAKGRGWKVSSLSKPSVVFFFQFCFSKNNSVLILLILYLSISWLKDMFQIHFLNIWFEMISRVKITACLLCLCFCMKGLPIFQILSQLSSSVDNAHQIYREFIHMI